MGNKILISIKVIQRDAEQNSNELEFATEAKFYKKDNKYYISYKESEVTGMENTKTTIKISSDTVNIIRFGEISSNMTFQKDKEFSNDYNTPYGIMNMIVKSNDVKINIDENGGEIYLDYDIDMNGERVGKNIFELKIK